MGAVIVGPTYVCMLTCYSLAAVHAACVRVYTEKWFLEVAF
jgi:hypothetical protein